MSVIWFIEIDYTAIICYKTFGKRGVIILQKTSEGGKVVEKTTAGELELRDCILLFDGVTVPQIGRVHAKSTNGTVWVSYQANDCSDQIVELKRDHPVLKVVRDK